MKREETRSNGASVHKNTQPADSHDSGKTRHAARFVPVFDSRNRKVPGLSQRGGKFYGQLWVEVGGGKKSPRRFPLNNPDGSSVASLTEAREAFELLRHQRREDKLPVLGHKPNLADYADDYLASGKFSKKKSGTQENERQAIERWKRHCGGVRIDRITTATISSYIDRRLKGELDPGQRILRPASERTVQLDVVVLRNLLKAAKNDGKIRELPGMPELEVPKPRKKPTVTPADLERLIAIAPSACDLNGEQLSDYLRFLCYCGAREQEALRIRWPDVDFDGGSLTIGADGDTKNKETRRVEMNPSLRAHLEDMKKRRQPDSEWLFPSPRRGKVDRPAKTLRESLRLARTAAKLPAFGFHDCRRFFATMAIQAGVDIQTVARWLGHRDGGILVAKTYADVLEDHRKRMATRLTFGAER